MNRNSIVATWSWLMLATLLEVSATYYLGGASWQVRNLVISAVAVTAIVPMALTYLGLLGEHLSIKLLILAGVFFSMDLVLIWTASLVH